MTRATTTKIHFGIPNQLLEDVTEHLQVDDGSAFHTFCGSKNIGPGENEDKFATDSRSVNCGDCQEAMDKLASYALRNPKKIPKYVRSGQYGCCAW